MSTIEKSFKPCFRWSDTYTLIKWEICHFDDGDKF